jgi:ribonuclease HI
MKMLNQRKLIWNKPQPNVYKLNIDACYFPNGSSAARAIICNYKGEAITGSSSLMQNLGDATSADAAALLHGLQLVERIGCSPVTIESDFMELVQAFNGEIQIWSLLP